MVEFKDIGIKIYRLRLAQDNSEFLIYDIDKKKYYQYSMNRGKSMLRMMFEKIYELSILEYMINKEYLDPNQKGNLSEAANKLFQKWINDEILMIDNINYKPIDQEIFEEEGFEYFNVYEKSDMLRENYDNIKPNFEIIKVIIMNLVDNDKKAYTYFCKWLAWQLQNPEQRLATSIIFKGEQGTGKTLLCNYVLRKIWGKNYTEVGQADISKDYNDFIMGKQLIIGNEVIHSDNKLVVPEKLKNYVSDDFVSINRKYRDSLNVKNYAQWIFVSNNQIPIKLGRKDRRYSVFNSKTLKNGFQIFLSLKQNQDEEVKGFVKYLLELSVMFDEVNAPFQNESRKDLIEASLNSVESFLESVIEAGGIDALNKEYHEHDNLWHNYLTFITKPSGTYIRLDAFYNLYMKFCIEAGIRNKYGRNGFSSLLKHLGFKLSIIKDDDEKSARCMLLTQEIQK